MVDIPNERVCPHCAENIKAEAVLCRHCGHGVSEAHFRKCPACAEMIRREATMCRFCRTAVERLADAQDAERVMRSWSEAENKQALELQYGVNYLSLDSTAVWPDCLMLLGEDEIRQFKAVPVRRSGKRLMIAMVNPNDVRALDAIKSQIGTMIQPVVCTAESFERFMATKYHSLLAQTNSEDSDEHAQDEESVAHDEPPRRARPRQGMPVTHDAPIVLLANMILSDGIKCGAIEIRIEPHGDNTKVFNVTRGETKLARTLPAIIGASLVARFKEMASIRGGGRKGAADITIADRPYRLVVEAKQSKSGEGLVLQARPGAE